MADAEDVTHVLTDKYAGVPGWGWVAIVGVGGGAGWLLIRRLRGGRSSGDATPLAAADAAGSNPFGSGGGGAGGGGSAGGDFSTQPIGGGTTRVDEPMFTTQPAPGPDTNTSPLSDSLPAKFVAPAGKVLAGGGTVTNPVGYTQLEADRNASYEPSYLDRLTERPQGVTFSLVAPAAAPNQYATVYTNVPAPVGKEAGKIVDAAHMITGERYVDLGAGKFQVKN